MSHQSQRLYKPPTTRDGHEYSIFDSLLAMCRPNWPTNDDWFGGEPNKPLQPLPRLAWAVPVDIANLGAALEAQLKVQEEITTLQLCNRYCPEVLPSKLPVKSSTKSSKSA
ncbi:hypothetical protein BDV95DRAFT_568518 [Massariosphaeria phaeospora]|uniref:Uncharacterized protein n=1 Tax=Massariosphaeria phaeospora TaxID=100035 RepID=A0A7C8MA68_9PLEO|nr:hypothetical protein BDV95DRAFT_568518 [Massariosphaeria phaeospora]